VIADAPPHGLGESGDGFPNGCPCGIDPLQTAKKMAENNIVIYSVAVEPNLSNYKNAKAFYKGIAQTTHGRFLNLGQAQLLPDVIIGGSAEELDLKKIEEEVETEVARVKSAAPSLPDVEVGHMVHKNLAAKGVTTWHLDVTHQDEYIPGEAIFTASESLSSAKIQLEAPSAPTTSGSASPFSFLSGIFGSSTSSPTPAPLPMNKPAPKEYESQKASVYHDTVSYDQVSKVMRKKKS